MFDENNMVLVAPCAVCADLFTSNPHTVPSVWINTETRCPLRPDGTPIEPGESGTQREPLCERCARVVRAAVGHRVPVAKLFPRAHPDRIQPKTSSARRLHESHDDTTPPFDNPANHGTEEHCSRCTGSGCSEVAAGITLDIRVTVNRACGPAQAITKLLWALQDAIAGAGDNGAIEVDGTRYDIDHVDYGVIAGEGEPTADVSYRFTDHSHADGVWCRWTHTAVVPPELRTQPGDRRCPAGCPASDIEAVPTDPDGPIWSPSRQKAR